MKTNKEILSILFICAEKYKTNLLNYSLLFIYADKHSKISYLEVTFDKSNFLHLTGCKTKLSASDFFKRCVNKRLSTKDFKSSDDGTTELKLQILPSLMEINLSANCIGDFNNNRPKLYTEKLAGNVKGCMGFKQNSSGRYIPNTVLNTDIRNEVISPMRILVTYRKSQIDKEYKDIVYKAKNIDWSSIVYPLELNYLAKPK